MLGETTVAAVKLRVGHLIEIRSRIFTLNFPRFLYRYHYVLFGIDSYYLIKVVLVALNECDAELIQMMDKRLKSPMCENDLLNTIATGG
ncbi:hypothetical protein D3C76_1549270 [compost metagenome]